MPEISRWMSLRPSPLFGKHGARVCRRSHCKNCQKQTGTAFSSLVGIPKRRCPSEGSLRRFMTLGIAARQLIETSVPSAVRPLSLTPP